jgi:hypothetical protein
VVGFLWRLLGPWVLRLLPYLAVAGAIYVSWWYVGSLRTQNDALRVAVRDAETKTARAYADIRQRIDMERRQRETDAEAARLAQMARDRVPAVAARLRDYRLPAAAAAAPSQPDGAGNCAPAVTAEATARAGAVDLACAATDADRESLAAEVLRLHGELERLIPAAQ